MSKPKKRRGTIRLKLFAIANRMAHTGQYLGDRMYKTREEAQAMSDSMLQYYEEKGFVLTAKDWKEGEHIVVPVVVSLPKGWEGVNIV